jgi:integrase
MHQLWKHPNGKWYVLYGPRLQKRVSTRTGDRGKAEIWLSNFIAGAQEPAPTDSTVGQILAGYETEHGPETRSHALKYDARHLKAGLGSLQPLDLTPPVIKRYSKARLATGAKPGTILREVGTLRAALAWGVDNKWIAATSKPAIANPVKTPKPRNRWLTKTEARNLIAACDMPHIKLFVMLGLMTVARKAAILEAKWDQVDFERERIDYGEGHGNKRRAIVPLNADMLAMLKAAKALAATEYVVEYRGEKVSDIKNGFKGARKRAGLGPDVTPHILRHSGATWMALDGVPIREMARMLGDSEETTERVYAKFHPDYLKRAAGALQITPVQ